MGWAVLKGKMLKGCWWLCQVLGVITSSPPMPLRLLARPCASGLGLDCQCPGPRFAGSQTRRCAAWRCSGSAPSPTPSYWTICPSLCRWVGWPSLQSWWSRPWGPRTDCILQGYRLVWSTDSLQSLLLPVSYPGLKVRMLPGQPPGALPPETSGL